MGTSSTIGIEPLEMGWTPDGHARIVWVDGHVSTYPPAHLRKVCPCADCRGTHGTTPKAFVILSPAKLKNAPRQVIIDKVEPVGNYAIAFTWGDGHREGIYTWSVLRNECPCDACALRKAVDAEGRP